VQFTIHISCIYDFLLCVYRRSCGGALQPCPGPRQPWARQRQQGLTPGGASAAQRGGTHHASQRGGKMAQIQLRRAQCCAQQRATVGFHGPPAVRSAHWFYAERPSEKCTTQRTVDQRPAARKGNGARGGLALIDSPLRSRRHSRQAKCYSSSRTLGA